MKGQEINVKKIMSINNYRNNKKKFYETEKLSDDSEYLNKSKCLEKYIELVENKPLKLRIDIIIKALGLDPNNHTLYHKMMILIQLIPYVNENFHILLLGEKGTFKSTPYDCYSKLPYITSGISTVAELRGSKINANSAVLLKEEILVFEEIADASDVSSLSILKDALQSGSYKDRELNSQQTPTSCVFNGNIYSVIDKIEELKNRESIFGKLSKDLIDDAFLDRFNCKIFKDNKFKLTSASFLGDDDEGLNINIFMGAMASLKTSKYEFNLNLNFDNPRDISGVSGTVKGLCKMLYPENNIPPHVKEGLISVAFHFRTIGREFNDPFPSKTIPFIIDAMGLSNLEEVSIVGNRVLVKEKNSNEYLKIGLNEWGIEENKMELKYFSENHSIHEFIAPINIKESTNLIVKQKYYPLYSKMHSYLPSGELVKRIEEDYKANADFNLLLIDHIHICAVTNNDFNRHFELKEWKRFTKTQLENFANSISGKRIDLKKRNYYYDNKENFKIINFFEYL